MRPNSDDQNHLHEVRKISAAQTGILILSITISYALFIAWLMTMHLTVFEQAACAFFGMTLGYGLAGRFTWSVLRAVTKLPVHKCIFWGTVLGYAMGVLSGAALAFYLAR